MKKWTHLLTLITLATVLGGCGAKVSMVNPDNLSKQTADQQETADQDGTKEGQNQVEPREIPAMILLNNINTINPNKVQDVNAASIVNMVGEGLYRQNKDGKYELGLLASDPEQVNDHTYRLKLKDNAKWSDGTPVTAADLVYSWQSLVNPKNNNGNGDLLNGVVQGATAIQQGKQDPNTLGIQAKDAKTIEVTFEQPINQYHTLESLFARSELFPLPSEKVKTATDYADYGQNAENVLSNGPYIMKNWQSGGWRTWQLVRNPHYDNEADYPAEQINVHVVDDFAMAATNFKDQMADIMPTLTKEKNVSWNETHYLAFNLSDSEKDQGKPKSEQNVVNNQELRALLLAPLKLDDALTQLTRSARKADDLVPMSQDGGAKAEGVAVSEEKVNQILDDYGYEALELSLIVRNDNDDVKMAEVIKSQIEKAYARVVVDVVPMRNENFINRQLGIVDYRDERYAEHYDLILDSQVQSEANNTYALYRQFNADSPRNHLGINSAKVNDILQHYTSANASLSPSDRQVIEQALADEKLVLPLYDTETSFTHSSAITGDVTTKAGYLYDFKGLQFTSGDDTIPKGQAMSD
ncbi:MAG: ABC transporter substrate-binding protein [Aerococcus sp.]|nr:ABC transporter substrate-binding protein [Aerococcus sp.]